jgi:hypothetical protein
MQMPIKSIVTRMSLAGLLAAAILGFSQPAVAQESPSSQGNTAPRPCQCWIDVKTGKKVPTVPLGGKHTEHTEGTGAAYAANDVEMNLDGKTAFNTKTGQNYARQPDGSWIDIKTQKCVPTKPLGGKHTEHTEGTGAAYAADDVEINIDGKTAFNTKTGQNYALEDCTPPTETATTPPSAEDCDAAIKNISDLVDQFASTSESVGTVKQRIANSEITKDIPPEEKKAALTADNAILKDKQQQALKRRGEIMDAWNVISRNKPCAKSGSQLRRLLDDLENKSQRIGGFQEALDRHIGLVDPKGLDAERSEAKSLINEIKDLFESCCAKKVSQNPPESFKQTEVFVGYQYERAPDESAKNLNGFDAQFFYNFKKHIGIGGDVGCAFGSDQIGTTTDVTLHRCTYLFGPQFNAYPTDKVRIFFHTLVGGVHDTTKLTTGTLSTDFSANAFMMSFGGGVDLKVKHFRKVFFRPVEIDIQPAHFGGQWQKNTRLMVGIGFNIGY